MGSKSSKWLAGALAATALAVVPAGAGAKLDYSRNAVNGEVHGAVPTRLDYSRNAVNGEVHGAVPTRLDYSRNSVSGEYLPSAKVRVPVGTHWPAAPSQSPSKAATPAAKSDSGFSWGDASIGAGVALLLAFGGVAIARRRHPSPLAS